MEIINPFFLLLILVSFTTICSFSLPPKPFPSAISTLDPKQLTALQYLNIPISKDPCRVPSHLNATACDGAQPFQHLTMLHLINCSDDTEMSSTAMKSLITLQDLGFVNCPIQPVRLPSELSLNLKSFTCIDSLTKVTGVWLSRFQNLTNLKISNVEINASGPSIILSNMKNLRSVIISNTTLTGLLPKFWHSMNITSLDLSNNKLKGHLPTSITFLSNLNFLNLSSNSLSGEIPNTFGDLLSLQNVSFAYNSMSGQIPQSMADISSLLHLDLGSNQFNGSIPKFLSEMKNLKYLNLENNNFHGVMPFNFSFVKKLEVFKVGGNSNLCYNKSVFSSKLKLGIAPCDKYGLPISPPPQRASDSSSYKYNGDDDQEKSSHKSEHQEQHGPNKLILGVGIGLCSVVFLIIFIIFLSKRCK